MSRKMKRGLLGSTGLVAALCVGIAAWLVVPEMTFGEPASVGAPHRIVLEARDLAFRVAGGTANPLLQAKPGEPIQIVVRNTDPGVVHSISIPGVMDEVRLIPPGEEIVLDLLASETGRYEYVCVHHLPSMKGDFVVASRAPSVASKAAFSGK